MKLFYAFLALVLCCVSPAFAQIRMIAVNPANQQITIKNFGPSTDISGYRLCGLLEYDTFGTAAVTIISGDYALMENDEVTIQWNATSGFNTSASDIGLYLPTGGFGTAANMVDFMQYGAGGQGREGIAVQAGLWTSGTFLTGTGPWVYQGDGLQNGIAQWGAGDVEGCMAPGACNFDPFATMDNGSCLFVGFPCDDGDPTTASVINGECICAAINEGCTASDACNYDPDAVEEDFSCVFPGDICNDNDPGTVLDTYNTDCVCVGQISGCTNSSACNFNQEAAFDNGSCLFVGDGCDDGNVFTANDIYTGDCTCVGEIVPIVEGCTASDACNFNPLANVDDGSCQLPGFPCDDQNDQTTEDFLSADCVCAGILNGCAFPLACNFNPGAIIDDGTCIFPGDPCDDGIAETLNDAYGEDCICFGTIEEISGCTASDACNFNPLANVEDGSCQLPGFPCDDLNDQTTDDFLSEDCVCAGILNGCALPQACNFNPEALIDDGSCAFPGDGCDDGNENTVSDSYNDECGCEGIVLSNGCTNPDACNFVSTATVDDGSCLFIGALCEDGDANTINDAIQSDCNCAGEPLTTNDGCTAPDACNFDPEATIDDGSCQLPGFPCDDLNDQTTFDIYTADCACVGTPIGCTNNNACNYNAGAIEDDGSCTFPGDACDDNDLFTINDSLGVDCVCDGDTITGTLGCTAMEACNYNPDATIEDGSCQLPGFPCDDLNDQTIFDVYTADCACVGTLIGCTNNTACNYNPEAIEDDGSCTFPGDSCDDNDLFTINDTLGVDCVCDGDTITGTLGCTAMEACNYNPDATIEDGSCLLPGYPCDDNDENTFNDTYGIDCICAGQIIGCIDETACNFNPLAVFDDGTCVFPGGACDDGDANTENDIYDADCGCSGVLIEVLGCIDTDACNYDENANTDDGSCYFVGDTCDDGNANTTNDVYNMNCECEGVVSVEEISAFYSIYPNPTNGMITVAQREGAAIQLIEVIDITGKRVATFNPNASWAAIDLNALAHGLYTLNIHSNNEVKSVRVQKN